MTEVSIAQVLGGRLPFGSRMTVKGWMGWNVISSSLVEPGQ